MGLRSYTVDTITPDRDPLTGLPNRALFAELYRYAVARSERLGLPIVVLTCSLPQIAEIEGAHERGVVDSIRRYLATRLRGLLRASDLGARTERDEFVAVLSDFDRFEDVRFSARQLGVELAAPFRVLGCDVEIRPVVEVTDRLPVAVCDDVTGLDVIDLRDEQLVSHFQPIIDVADGSVAGAEALLRWQHPTHGILTAGQFFGVAASNGMLEGIADSSLVCAMAGWGHFLARTERPAPRLFVNLTPSQLYERSIVHRLHELMSQSGLIADDVVVEITEGEVASRFEDVVDVIAALRATGIRIALDDFGAGHSSLGRLRQLEVDVVKVDRSLVSECDRDARAQALLSSVLTISQAMGAECVVEGIETPAESEAIAGLGFRFVQGYHLGRPVAVEEFASMLEWSALLRTG